MDSHMNGNTGVSESEIREISNSENNEDRSRKKFISNLTALIIVSLFFLTTLQITISGSVSAAESRVLSIGFSEPVTSANPYIGIYDVDYVYYGFVYDYLIFPDENGIATPNLAAEWWYMDGPTAAASGSDFSGHLFSDPADWPLGSVWEYNLTPDVYWSDGVPFTADDVKWTIDIQIGANFMTYWAYQPVTRWIDHVDKLNDLAVRIFFSEFESRRPIPIAWGDSMDVPIMPKHAFEGRPTTYIAQEWDGLPAIGTGIFKGTVSLGNEIIAKESITLVRNEFYNFTEDGAQKGLGAYFKRDVQIDKLIMIFFSEEQVQILSLKTGKIDVTKLTPANYLAMQVDASLAEEVKLISLTSCTVYTKESHWNLKKESSGTLNPARLDPALHRASALATNKSAIVEGVFKNLGVPGYHLITPVWSEWYWEPDDSEISWFNVTAANGTVAYSYNDTLDKVMDYNIDRANAILDAAGYEWTGTPGNSVREIGQVAAERLVAMGYSNDASEVLGLKLDFEDIVDQSAFEDKETAEYLSQQWKDVGINLAPKLVNQATWSSDIYSYTFHFTETYWSGDVDPNYLLYILTTYAIDGWNEFGTENETYDYYYKMQAMTLDYEDRMRWVEECCKWTYLYSGMIVTCYPEMCFAYYDSKWTNWGDWEAHPGLAIDHFWGQPPFLYHIQWAGVGDENGGGLDGLIIAGVILAAIVAVVVSMFYIRKRKEKMLLEEKEEGEPTDQKKT